MLPLKTIKFYPFRTFLALGSCSRSFALSSIVLSFLINRSIQMLDFGKLRTYRRRSLVYVDFFNGLSAHWRLVLKYFVVL